MRSIIFGVRIAVLLAVFGIFQNITSGTVFSDALFSTANYEAGTSSAAMPLASQIVTNLNFSSMTVGDVKPFTFTLVGGTYNEYYQVYFQTSGTTLGFSTSSGGPFSSYYTDVYHITTFNSWTSPTIYVKALQHTEQTYISVSGDGLAGVYGDQDYISVAAAPPPTPAPTPLTTIVANWTVIPLTATRSFAVDVVNSTPNQSRTVFVVERFYNTLGGNNMLVGFSLNPNGPFSGSLNVPITIDSAGKGRTAPIYAKGLQSTIGVTNPVPAILAQGINAPSIPPVVPYQISVAPPIVRFRSLSDIKVGVGAVDRNYVEVFYGQPNLTTTITITPSAGSQLMLSTSSQGVFTETLQVPIILDNTGYGKTAYFWVKGASADPQITTRLAAKYFHPVTSLEYSFEIGYVIVQVATIVVERVSPSTPFDTNPHIGGGLRVFPEKATAADTNIWRDRVKITATLNRPIAGVTIDFAAPDIDDPSSDSADLDANGLLGNDNRAYGYLLQDDSSFVTNGNGQAFIVFELSHQPGDNYRFVATARGTPNNSLNYIFSSLAIDGTELRLNGGDYLPHNNANDATQPMIETSMVTVWRRLHIERDSMTRVVGNSITRNITSVTDLPRGTLLNLDGAPMETGRFKNGRVLINIDGYSGSCKIMYSTANTVLIAEEMTTHGHAATATLYDDDDMNGNDPINLDGDTNEEVPAPNTGWIQDSDDILLNSYARSYIRPTYDLTGTDNYLPFYLNQPKSDPAEPDPLTADFIAISDFDNIGSASDSQFWTVYLFQAYQAPVPNDWDQDDDYLINGLSGYVAQTDQGYGSFIYLENDSENRDHKNPGPDDPAWSFDIDARDTVRHEIAHLLNADHPDGGCMDGSYNGLSDKSVAHLRSTRVPTSGE
jgi:hypothetical protein